MVLQCVVLQNILNNYDVRVDVIPSISYGNELGAEFIPALLILLPETTQFINAILPAIKTYIEVRKPSGTKHVIELANGEKKIHIINEDGKEIDIDKMIAEKIRMQKRKEYFIKEYCK